MHIATITYCENVALVTLRNVASEGLLIGEIFTAISGHGINVDMISQTAPQGGTISLAFTVSTESVAQLLPILNGFKPAAPELGVELTAGMTSRLPTTRSWLCAARRRALHTLALPSPVRTT